MSEGDFWFLWIQIVALLGFLELRLWEMRKRFKRNESDQWQIRRQGKENQRVISDIETALQGNGKKLFDFTKQVFKYWDLKGYVPPEYYQEDPTSRHKGTYAYQEGYREGFKDARGGK